MAALGASRTPFPSSPLRADRKCSVITSGDAKMAAGSGGPAARELFAEGLLQFLRPAVRQLDGHVHAVRCGAVRGGGPRFGPAGRCAGRAGAAAPVCCWGDLGTRGSHRG